MGLLQRGGIFSLETPLKSESVGTFEVPFMSMVGHCGSHHGSQSIFFNLKVFKFVIVLI